MAASPPQSININVTPAGHTRSYNMPGKATATETVNHSGSATYVSDIAKQELVNNSYQIATKENYIRDISGNDSKIVTGQKETVTASNYKIVGTPELNKMGYQAIADQKQLALVAARSQPDQAPDPTFASALLSLLTPAPHLFRCIKQPAAEKYRKQVSLILPPSQGSLVEGIMYDITTEMIKINALISSCTLETLGQIATIQLKHMKDSAMKMVEAKQKMFSKLSDPSKEAFKENMGNVLFPDGKITIESSAAAINAVSDPGTLAAMFIPPSTENLPKKNVFNEDEYKKRAADAYTEDGGILDVERNI